MQVTYRMNTIEDEDELVNFWSKYAGWDQIDKAVWEHRFMNTPMGRSSVALAIDDDSKKIIGQFIFVPSKVSINGKEVSAFRPFAPVVYIDMRNGDSLNALQNLILEMYNLAAEDLKRKGAGLFYMVPDPRWIRAFKIFPFFQIAKFPLWSKNLPLENTYDIPEIYNVEEVEFGDPRMDKLWESASANYQGMVVRNNEILKWKVSHAKFYMKLICCQSEPVGFFAFARKDKQYLLADMITKDNEESLKVTLSAACNYAHTLFSSLSPEGQEKIQKIAVLATPPIEAQAKELGFFRDNYDFSLILHVLDEELKVKGLTPEHWYASGND